VSEGDGRADGHLVVSWAGDDWRRYGAPEAAAVDGEDATARTRVREATARASRGGYRGGYRAVVVAAVGQEWVGVDDVQRRAGISVACVRGWLRALVADGVLVVRQGAPRARGGTPALAYRRV